MRASKFRSFINSFLIDMLVFIVAILTVFTIFIIIYIVTGQSKLKALVATMADTKSYVSLDLNKIARNTHLFKLTGELSLENVALRKNWIWDVLEIRWDDICIILNEKKIHLPTTLIIPLLHKLKVRKLFGKRGLLHMYVM